MALFKEHVSVAAIAGALGAVLLYFYAFVTDPILLALLFVIVVVSSFLPDLDSDSGIPFFIIFGLFTLACSSFALLYALEHYRDNWLAILGLPAATFLFVWFVVGELFKNFTEHRGIMHSLPAMAIVGLLAFLGAMHLEQGEMISMWFAIAAAVGFASHLILDEIHSEVNFDGIPFVPKRSLGTALKLFSGSKLINLLTYATLILLVYTVYHTVGV